MKFTSMTDLLYKVYTLCARNDKKTQNTFCCKDLNTDMPELKEYLTNKTPFQIMVRTTGFESQDYRIEGFKSFLRPTDYKIYNVSYKNGYYHLIAARA